MRTLLATTLCACVLGGAALAAEWTVPDDFATIQDAIDDAGVVAGDTIRVGPGAHAGAFVTKRVEIKGMGGAKITSGPLHRSGLVQAFRLMGGSDGTTIGHLTFEGVDLVIMNGAGVDDVTVTHCVFIGAVQGISNWYGSSWTITHNVMTDFRTRNGGGIGILIADFTGGGPVTDNLPGCTVP